MKFLLVLVVVLIGVWMWRNGRQLGDSQHKPQAPKKNPAEPQEMVSCQLCGVHFPRADAVTGRLGVYCCSEHHLRAEP